MSSDASRREVLKVVGAGASGLALATVVSRQPAELPVAARAAAVEPAVAPPAPFLADLVGKHLGSYRVHAVGALERGGIPVVLATAAGQHFRVDVLRVDPSDGTAGIGVAGAVSVYLRNGGDGNTATDEEQGLGAMALAEELLRRDREGRKPPSALLTRGERRALDAVLETS